MNNLIEILSNDSFKNILKNNLSDVTEDLFDSFKNSLTSSRYIIPVLGVQGSGKSSFLNALLLKDIILPVDADETTCIPTEISYAENEQPIAEIYYKNGLSQKIDCSENSLKPYIHNAENPSNKKGIDYISIKFSHPLLKTGVVFVDLPGVGSLTNENIKTTSSYIKKATGAIFMLRTVPPITRDESIFIKGILPLLSKTFFVQNQWIDESFDEVEDAKDHNLSILKKIFINKYDDLTIDIDIVNVMFALNSGIKDDINLLNKSGLSSFIEKINTFIKNWKSDTDSNINQLIINYIESSKDKINLKINLNKKSHEDQLLIYQEQEKTFYKELNDKKLKIEECFDILTKEKIGLNKKINEICKNESENLRNQVRSLIINGNVNKGLNKAFNDYSNQFINNIYEKLQPEILEISYKINDLLGDIGDFSFNNISHKERNGFNDKSKSHQYYSNAGSIVGTGLGISAGSSIIGTTVTLGTVAIPIPGVGTLVGLGIGLGITAISAAFGSFLGKKIKEAHLSIQKFYTESELFKLIEQFKTETIADYKKNLSDYCNNIEKTINSWIIKSEESFENNIKSLKENALKSDEEKEILNNQLTIDINILDEIYAQLNI